MSPRPRLARLVWSLIVSPTLLWSSPDWASANDGPSLVAPLARACSLAPQPLPLLPTDRQPLPMPSPVVSLSDRLANASLEDALAWRPDHSAQWLCDPRLHDSESVALQGWRLLRLAEALARASQSGTALALLGTLEGLLSSPPAALAASDSAALSALLPLSRAAVRAERGESRGSDARAALAVLHAGPWRGGLYEALARVATANAERTAGRYIEALTLLDEAEALIQNAGLNQSYTRTLVFSARGVAMYDDGDIEGSLRQNEVEIAMKRSLLGDDSPELLFPYIRMSASLGFLHRHVESDRALAPAEAILQRLPATRQAHYASAVMNVRVRRVAMELDQGYPQTAQAEAREALAFGRLHLPENSLWHFEPLYWIGLTTLQRGQISEALEAFEQARTLLDAQPPDTGYLERAMVLTAGMETAVLLRDPAEYPRWRDALASLLAGHPPSKGRQYYEGSLYRAEAAWARWQGQWAQAAAFGQSAWEVLAAATSERDPFALDTLSDACEAALMAEPDVESARRTSTCGTLWTALVRDGQPALPEAAPVTRSGMLSALASYARATRPRAPARDWLFQSVVAAERYDAPQTRIVAWWTLAQDLRRHPSAPWHREQAVALGKAVIEEVQRLRVLASLPAGALPEDWGTRAAVLDAAAREQLRRERDAQQLKGFQTLYRTLAAWLAEDGRLAEAAAVLRELKEAEWFELARGKGTGSTAAAPVDWTAREQLWKDRWPGLQWALQRSTGDPSATTSAGIGTATAAADNVVASASPARDDGLRVQAWANWITLQPPARARSGRAPAPHRASRPKVPAGELHAWYFADENRINLVIAWPGGAGHHRLVVGEAEVAARLGALQRDLAARRPVTMQLQALNRDIAAPLRQALARHASQRLVLHVDGVLRHLPFAALHDGRTWLSQQVAVVHRLPAGSAITGTAGANVVRRLDALGASLGDAEMPPLPGVEAELCQLVDGPVHGLVPQRCAATRAVASAASATAARLPGEAWLNQRFDTARLRVALAESATPATALHIATHFRLRPGALNRSWLLTGDGQRVTLEQMNAWPMHQRPLVSLSACETAVGADDLRPGEGRERDGLPGLFLRGGAHRVLATLWPVEDASTATLMGQVYAGLGRNQPVAEALRRAQGAMSQSPMHQHPAYWAGFVAFEAAPSR